MTPTVQGAEAGELNAESTMTEFKVQPIIGLEVHAQLATASKLFCDCATTAAPPNAHTCPICTGQPGALPQPNRAAVELAALAGMALNCEIHPSARWDRKSYFYPDLPKNYQITQYAEPLCRNGYFELKHDDRIHKIRIQRAHLEEDAGKCIHDASTNETLIDLNRAGIPLIEIVTAPDFRDARTVREFAVELQRLLRYLGVSFANMEAGQLRFEPNINLELTDPAGKRSRTPIVEVKNLNSFKALESAIEFELTRQRAALQAGELREAPEKENRGWDESRGVTVAQRAKEAADEYRYFAEPDLPALTLESAWVDDLREQLPELPLPRIERFISEYKLNASEAAALVNCRSSADLLDAAVETGGPKVLLAQQFLTIWSTFAHQRSTTIAGLGLAPEHLASVARLVDAGTLNATAATSLAQALCERADAHFDGAPRPSADGFCVTVPALSPEALDPAMLARELQLIQTDDRTEIGDWVRQAIADQPDAARDALQHPKKAEAAFGFLLGQVMQRSGGRSNPAVVREVLFAALAERTADLTNNKKPPLVQGEP